jgi:hypothetical protein
MDDTEGFVAIFFVVDHKAQAMYVVDLLHCQVLPDDLTRFS